MEGIIHVYFLRRTIDWDSFYTLKERNRFRSALMDYGLYGNPHTLGHEIVVF